MRLSNYENLDLEPWQLDICKEYCENDMKLLKKSCYKMIKRKNLDGNEFYDDLIDESMFVLIESVLTYDKEIKEENVERIICVMRMESSR